MPKQGGLRASVPLLWLLLHRLSSTVGAVGISPSRRQLLHSLEGESNFAPLAPGVYLAPHFLTSQQCEDLTLLANPADFVASEAPLASLSSKRLFALCPLLLATSYAATMVQEAGSFVGNLLMQTSFVLVVLAAGFSLIKIPAARQALGLGGSRSSRVTPLKLADRGDAAASIVLQACELLKCSPDRLERPALTHYAAGQEFGSHHDASADLVADGWDRLGGQRISTLLLYLNELPEQSGGCTVFDSLGVRVRPQRGAALLFFPASDEAGIIDDRMLHRAEAPQEGQEKRVVQIWQRQQRVPPPLGLTDDELALLQ